MFPSRNFLANKTPTQKLRQYIETREKLAQVEQKLSEKQDLIDRLTVRIQTLHTQKH